MSTQGKKQVLNDINQAIKYSDKQQYQKALIIFDNYLKNLPDDFELIVQFGQLCKSLGKTDLAINYLSKAVDKKPDDPVIHGLLGGILLDDKQYQEADIQLRLAIEISPDSWQLLLHLGIANSALGNYDAAIDYLAKARTLKPGSSEIHENLAACMFMTDCNIEAQDYAKKAIKLEPKNYNAYNLLALSLSQTGDIAEAIKYLEKSIKLDELNPNAYVNLTTIKNFSSKDRQMIRRIEKILETSMPAINRSRFCFALGKMYDGCQEWSKAFSCIKQANLLAKPGYQENPVPKKHLKSLNRVFSTELFEKTRPLGNQSDIPVFIVGMPRSGTTLIEQIIASHPEAEGAGELEKIESIADMIGTTDNPGQYQTGVHKILNEQSINELSSMYLGALRKNREEASRISDKTTNNYFHLGLITILFPNARIIHVSRSPLDTCISCYFQYFRNRSFGWTFDPEWISNTYHSYRQIISFWQRVLPENKMLEVQYEQLISDPESHIRHILDYCGLDWDPGCLNFYKTRNIVKTASKMQVRQPIYQGSIQRWKRYGIDVHEFATRLEQYLDETDKQQLYKLGIRPDSKKWWNFIAKV